MNGLFSVTPAAPSTSLPTTPAEGGHASAEQPPVEITFADVALFMPLGRAYSFAIPDALRASAVTGARVVCGLRGRRIVGVVLAVRHGDPGIAVEKLKPILAVVDAEAVVPAELLGFLAELANYYLSPIGEVLRLAVPAVERTRERALKQEGLAPARRLSAVGRALAYVLARTPAPGTAEATPALKGQAAEVWQHVSSQPGVKLTELVERWGNARAVVKKLEALGLVHTEQRSELEGELFSAQVVRDTAPELNAAQSAAVAAINEPLISGSSKAFLLHGVTASGKTEVYLHAVQTALAQGGSALILVPEIALTPQLVGRFRARLGDTIAVLHSGLSQRQRHVMWTLLHSGERRVVIGARSALFAPVQQLRLLCVDEEQDTSFKQEEGVRYNARDMALLRAQRAGAVCVLGSATPSLKSFFAVSGQKITRLVLPERAHRRATLPETEIVDLRRIGPGIAGERLLSLPLCRAIEEVLERKEQAILFLNRRGFAPSVVCEACGHILGCPSCEVPLTYHVNPRRHVVCHYCDYHSAVPERCPGCKSPGLNFEGIGTERIETVLSGAFPKARVGRLDRDTGPGLKSEHVLAKMASGELDILVGTQMVTKGHDLPRVSLVGVLNADAGLSMPDYQASERTFQLLVQVAGRAGRANTPGKVLIQTKNPEHPAISLALKHDVTGFVEYGLADRRALGYPPYSRLALVRVSAPDEALARNAATELAQIALRRAGTQAEILGPSPAPITRLRNQFRFRVMIRAKTRGPLRHVLLGIQDARVDRRVRVVVDIDPVNML